MRWCVKYSHFNNFSISSLKSSQISGKELDGIIAVRVDWKRRIGEIWQYVLLHQVRRGGTTAHLVLCFPISHLFSSWIWASCYSSFTRNSVFLTGPFRTILLFPPTRNKLEYSSGFDRDFCDSIPSFNITASRDERGRRSTRYHLSTSHRLQHLEGRNPRMAGRLPRGRRVDRAGSFRLLIRAPRKNHLVEQRKSSLLGASSIFAIFS